MPHMVTRNWDVFLMLLKLRAKPKEKSKFQKMREEAAAEAAAILEEMDLHLEEMKITATGEDEE